MDDLWHGYFIVASGVAWGFRNMDVLYRNYCITEIRHLGHLRLLNRISLL